MEISSTLQDQFANAIDTAVGTTGFARLYTAAYALKLTTAPLNSPAFGSAATGLITLDVGTPVGPIEDTAPVAGTAVLMGLYPTTAATSGAFIVAFGVATTGTPDIDMSNNVILTTDTVQVSSLSIQVPTGSPTT